MIKTEMPKASAEDRAAMVERLKKNSKLRLTWCHCFNQMMPWEYAEDAWQENVKETKTSS